MKKVLKAFSILLIGILLFGCSSDSPVAPVEVVKTKVKITKIEINTIPSLNSSGSSWDISSNPDVYIKLFDQITAGPIFSTIWNFIPSLSTPYIAVPTSQIITTDLTNTILKVEVWDNDSDDIIAGADDKIGEVSFVIREYITGSNKYPTYSVKSANGVVATIYMTWE